MSLGRCYTQQCRPHSVLPLVLPSDNACTPAAQVSLQRTRGRKPFTTNPKPAWAPNFNFNVSHEVRSSVAYAGRPSRPMTCQ